MIKRAIITSGPTIEPIDPVRFLSNRSSGKTGFYLATEAKSRGVTDIDFITGSSHYVPAGVHLVPVETTLEMRDAVLKYFYDADVIIMAAAVSDYKSSKYYTEKIKSGADKMTLELTKNPDILHELGQKKMKNQVLVGFAAETENIFENATKKLENKNLDLLVLNEISDKNPVFGEDYNQAYLVTSEGMKKLERMKKSELVQHIWEEIDSIYKAK